MGTPFALTSSRSYGTGITNGDARAPCSAGARDEDGATIRRGIERESNGREGRRERARQSVTRIGSERGAREETRTGGSGKRVYTADSSACSRAACAKSTSHTSELARVYSKFSPLPLFLRSISPRCLSLSAERTRVTRTCTRACMRTCVRARDRRACVRVCVCEVYVLARM